MTRPLDFTIRQARADEYDALGKLLVGAYAALPGMPLPAEQPDYYAMLENVAARAAQAGAACIRRRRRSRPSARQRRFHR